MLSMYNDDSSNKIQNSKLKMYEKSDSERTDQVITEHDKYFFNALVKAHKALSGPQVDLTSFKNSLEMLEELKKQNDHEYLNSLLRPEKTRGAKIPAPMPVPSSSFQLKQSFYVQTNALGNACVILNPYFLSGGGIDSSVYVNNDASLTGTIASNFFTAVNVGQVIPPVYNQYRLVSGSVVAKYVGRLDIVQGVIGGAVVFDTNVVNQPISSVNANLAKYGDFNLAQDSYYQQEHMSLEGIRELYFPLDNSFEEYNVLGTSRNGFVNLIYIQSAPPSTSSFKFDVYFNFECLPDNAFLNYIPTSVGTCGNYDKAAAVRQVQRQPITKESDMSTMTPTGGNFWGGLAQKFGTWLPKIGDLASLVLPMVGGMMA